MELISKPGLYLDMPADEYHADPVIEPSLSRSVALDILELTERHAHDNHPRLGKPALGDDDAAAADETKFTIGTAAHQMLLGGRGLAVLDFPDWRTKAAKEARQAAREAGLTPILASQHLRAKNAAAQIKAQLPNFGIDIGPSAGWVSEAVIVWNDPVGGWCRSMIDLLNEKGRVIDFKFTSIRLNAENVARQCANMQYEFQQAFYERGLANVFPQMDIARLRSDWFTFVFCEDRPPHAILPVYLPPAAVFKGRANVHIAMNRWAVAKKRGKWEMYSGRPVMLDYPPWQVAEFFEGTEK